MRNLRPESPHPRAGSACARALLSGQVARPRARAQVASGPAPGGGHQLPSGAACLAKHPDPDALPLRGAHCGHGHSQGHGAKDTDSVQDSCPGADAGAPSITGAMGVPRERTCHRRPLERRNPAGPRTCKSPHPQQGPLRSGTHNHQLSNPRQVTLEFPSLTSPRGPDATCPVLWRCWAHSEQQSHGASPRSPIRGQPTHGLLCRGRRCCAGPAS